MNPKLKEEEEAASFPTLIICTATSKWTSSPLRFSKNEEESDKAMKMVHGMQWKTDPILKKRGWDDQDVAPLSVQIANVVVPLWNVPYDEQLRRKKQEVEGVLQRLVRYRDMYKPMPRVAMLLWLFVQKKLPSGRHSSISISGTMPTTEYRNKCEFVIGIGANGEDDKSLYKGGSCAVVGPSDCIHVATKAKKVVCEFQKCIRTTPYSVYRPEAYEVRWKSQTVQTTTRTKQAVAVFFNPQVQKSGFKVSISQRMTKSDVTALYFVSIMFGSRRQSPNSEDLTCELVAGEECIHEELLGLEFKISPYYFFQRVNTWAAEVLSSAVGERAQLDKDSTVLDVCCRAGTIGISLDKRVRKVIGIEMFQETEKDAKVNGKSSTVERLLKTFQMVLSTVISPNVTAIVDPPRAGLRMLKKILESFWQSEHVKRLVYVACDAKSRTNRMPHNECTSVYILFQQVLHLYPFLCVIFIFKYCMQQPTVFYKNA
uniref:tRNA (uracil(54)-C(5))-methyltransferase n=1 Tax=Oncorhynchus mykiss TaxID=8022 RepID=A0A8C7VC74_ONCMY